MKWSTLSSKGVLAEPFTGALPTVLRKGERDVQVYGMNGEGKGAAVEGVG